MVYGHFLYPKNPSRKMARGIFVVVYLFILGLSLGSCQLINPISEHVLATDEPIIGASPASPTRTNPTDYITQPVPDPSATQSTHLIWLAPYLPEMMQAAITLPVGYKHAPTSAEADVTIQVGDMNMLPTSQWIYALVAPFPTIPDGVTFDELIHAWEGDTHPQFDGSPLLMTESTLGVLTAFWGAPNPQAVRLLSGDELLAYAWSNKPSWAIVPFEELEPRWKVLAIDDQSPIRKDFNPSTYSLTIPFILSSDFSLHPESLSLPSTNRDTSRLTTLVMTGVTALVRATAYTMELKGITYPALDIGSVLADADITHISNEIPFSPDCPYPSPSMPSLVFCSNPKYIELLETIGTDVIELTGDHFMDYGADATLYTLEMYQDHSWLYYGGGANSGEAQQPVFIENNGNRFAFIGCNIGCQVKTEIPCDAIATANHPGAAQCDFDWLSTEIPALREAGYQVIFTFQHREYYTYTTEPLLAVDFGKISAAGATIISGSQAHQPHGFSFEDESYIHYGLGNLFFDQFHYCGYYACDDAFIDRHVFYNGRHISTELITIHFVDYARPRLMTLDERVHFLELMFSASDW